MSFDSQISLFYCDTGVPTTYRVEVLHTYPEGASNPVFIPDGHGSVPTSPDSQGVYQLDLNFTEGNLDDISAGSMHSVDLGAIFSFSRGCLQVDRTGEGRNEV